MNELEMLEDAARERWGDQWSIEQLHFADGTTSQHAYRLGGLNDAGHLRKERLFVGADGEVYYDHVLLDKAEIVEVIEQDEAPAEIQSEIVYNDSE